MMILDFDGVTEVPFNGQWHGGRLHLWVRSDTEALFVEDAVNAQLMRINEDGDVVESSGVEMSHIGPIWSRDDPPVLIDDRHHVNIKLSGYALTRMDATLTDRKFWEVLGLTWMQYGSPDTQINNLETGLKMANTVLLEPGSFTPKRIWL
jgi:hypothetical protein